MSSSSGAVRTIEEERPSSRERTVQDVRETLSPPLRADTLVSGGPVGVACLVFTHNGDHCGYGPCDVYEPTASRKPNRDSLKRSKKETEHIPRTAYKQPVSNNGEVSCSIFLE